MASTSSRTTPRSTPPITSFPLSPLPTNYSPSADCSGVFLADNGVFMIDDKRTCLPSGFNQAGTAFFSPGVVCPTGYTAQPACSRTNALAPQVTTVTCCPVRRDLTLSCVSDPESLAGAFSTLFCTWQAGPQTVLLATKTESGNVLTTAVTLSGAQGVNAYGIKMVYQSSDLLSLGTTSSTTGSTATGGGAQQTQGQSGTPGAAPAGLTTGATVAVAVIVPLAVLAILGGAFFVWRRKRRSGGSGGGGGGLGGDPHQPQGYYAPAGEYKPGDQRYQPLAGYQHGSPMQPSEMSTPDYGPPAKPVELSAMNVPVELPGDGRRR